MSAKEGTVFILTNDAMPGFARLDFTTKDDLATRIRKINRSELPVPFRLYFAAQVANCELAERNMRYLFADYAEARDATYFKVNPDMLRAAIELAATAIVELPDEEIGISPQEREQMDKMRAYHDALRFEALNAEPGATLCFSRDRSVTCTAIGNGMVEFDGTAATPADASAKAMESLGFDWGEVAATDYWIPHAGPFAATPRTSAEAPGMDSVLTRMPNGHEEASSSPVMFIRNNKI